MRRTGAQACARAISMQVVTEREDSIRTSIHVGAQSRSRKEDAMIGSKGERGMISWLVGVERMRWGRGNGDILHFLAV